MEQGSHLGYTQGDPTPMALLGAALTATFPGWNGMPVALSVLGLPDGFSFFPIALWGIALVGVSVVDLPSPCPSLPL